MSNYRFKLPWYADEPRKVDDPLSLDWGYLVFSPNGVFEFIDERPSEQEILSSPLLKNLGVDIET